MVMQIKLFVVVVVVVGWAYKRGILYPGELISGFKKIVSK